MYLKALEMQGFKSFPDKIKLDFTRGLTAIVGPNGSGKSNITDAIRWVLGEQSAKMLRGAKMEDVIFSGTDTRKPLGFAEVSVTFDNADRKLNIEYDEVTVTRRVFRSGEGEYYINKSACRLKDVHELFMDTGLGRDGYSLVGQGKIDEILSNKSEDRRQVFEEAAGISKYKYRRIEAERKLIGTEDNLSRLSDIISELEDRIGPLEVQSEKAKKYLDLRERLKGLDATVSVENLDRLKDALSEINKNIRASEEEYNSCEAEVKLYEDKIGGLYASIGTTEQEIADIRESITSSEGSIKLNINQIEIFEQTISQNNEESLRLGSETDNIKVQLSEMEEETKSKKELLSGLEQNLSQRQGRLGVLLEEHSAKNSKTEELSQRVKAQQEEISQSLSEMSELKAALSGADALLENYKAQLAEVGTVTENLTVRLNKAEAFSKELKEKADKVQKLSLEKNNQAEKIKQDIAVLEKKRGADALLLKDKQSILDSKRHRIQVLLDLEKDYEGYQKGVKSVMQAKDEGILKCAIHAPLSKIIDVPEKYLSAIENALGNALQNIVTDCEEDAKSAIEYLKKNKLGRVTFLPISAVKPRDFGFDALKCKGYIGLGSELVKCEDKYKDIVSSLLGAVAVTDNIDNAIAMARKFSYKFKIATLDGEILNSGGSVSGGFSGRNTGILSRGADIKKLQSEAQEMNSAIDKMRSKYTETEREIDRLEIMLASVTDEENSLKEEFMKIAAEHNNAEYSINSIKQEIIRAKESGKQTEERISQIEMGTQGKRTRFAELSLKIKDFEKNAMQSEGEFEKAADELEAVSKSISALRLEIAETEKNIAVEREKINSSNSALQSNVKTVEAYKSQIEALDAKNKALKSDIEARHIQIKSLNEAIENYRSKLSEIEKRKESRNDEITACQSKVKKERERLTLIQKALSGLEVKKNKNETDGDVIVNHLWEEYGLTYVTAFQYKIEIESLPKAQREISSVKSQISALGNINIDAIEEYKAVRERYEFMSAQQKDLLEAKESLEKIISDMQELMKRIFAEQFSIINHYFGETFTRLFGGGRAELKLSDPSDILGSGIDIDVQPPGKKLQNLMLLSGGEKALCAIAIIFAILKTRPAPFCIFDEIEAALDDVNIYKFAEFLRVMNDNTQFMVVTHRRGTMEAADKLYGVTMPKKGISTMVELDVSQLENKSQGVM